MGKGGFVKRRQSEPPRPLAAEVASLKCVLLPNELGHAVTVVAAQTVLIVTYGRAIPFRAPPNVRWRLDGRE